MHPSRLSRRRFLTLTGAAAATPFLVRYGANAFTNAEVPMPAGDPAELVKGINRFGGELGARLTKDKPGSLFFSPLSLETALAMTAAGARGQTLQEMEQVLHLPPKDPHTLFGALLKHLKARQSDTLGPSKLTPPFELTIANAIWAQKGFPWHKAFTELTRTNYGTGLVEIDFADSEAARTRINAWVETETREKIKELVGPGVITALTRMVLANAIYFKGNWEHRFDKRRTREAPFTRPDGTKVNVPLMQQTAEFGYGEFTMFVTRRGEPVQVLELPYAGGELSMRVFLPKDPRGAERLPQWLADGNFDQAKLRTQRVIVGLPRFRSESAFSLKPVLMEMGMKSAFGDADFTGMSPEGKRLYISHVLHKAFVDVNEEGTEAAAATAVAIKERAAPLETVFRADRPFVYLTRDNRTGTALFLGRYAGPVK